MNSTHLFFTAAGVTAALAGTAKGQDWLDDFEDGSVRDGTPVSWVAVEPLPALMDITDGDLVLGVKVSGGSFAVGAAAVPIPFRAGISMRARMRASGAASAIGLSWQDPESDLHGYVAELTAGAELYILRVDNPASAVILDSAVIEFDATDDVLIQMNASDGLVEVTVWSPGTALPAPQLAVFDSNYSTGEAGLFIQDMGGASSTDATAIVRYAQAASTVLTHSDVGDLDGNGAIGAADLALLLGNWSGPMGCPPAIGGSCVGDLDGDGFVNAADLAILLGNWS